MKKHSIELYGHKTSFSLEDEFWQELKTIALQENKSLAQLIGPIDASRHSHLSSFSGLLRLMNCSIFFDNILSPLIL